MPQAAGTKVARLVFDDSSTLLILFGLPVPHQCRIPWGSPGVPSWSPSSPILVPFWYAVWYQFGSSLVPFWSPVWTPFWSQFCSSLVPVWSRIGPSLVPGWFQLGLKLAHFGHILEPGLVLIWFLFDLIQFPIQVPIQAPLRFPLRFSSRFRFSF